MSILYIFAGIIFIILCSNFCNNVNENNIGRSHYPIFLKEIFNRNNNFYSNVYNNIGRKKIKKKKNVYPESLGYIFLPLDNKLCRSNTNNNVSRNKCISDYVPNKKMQRENIFLFHNVHVINKKMKFQNKVSICSESKKGDKKRDNHVFMDKNWGGVFENDKTESLIDKNNTSNVINTDAEYNHPNIHNKDETYNNVNENNPMYEGMPSHLSDSNLESAMKKAEEYIKGKEDDIIERREKEKKKKIVEKMKGDEDVFTDKLLDLRMYDMLKYVYRNNIYRTSHELVNNICMWMKNTYSNYVDSNKEIERREKKKQTEEQKNDEQKKKKEELINISNSEKDTKHNETNINYKRVSINDKDVNIPEDITKGKKTKEKMDDEIQSEIIEKDISTNYSKDRNVQYLNTFSFDKNNEKLNNEMESLKLYNKKNLSKYFFSLYKGNILKQLVTEGENLLQTDEYIERKKKDDSNKYESNKYDSNKCDSNNYGSNNYGSNNYDNNNILDNTNMDKRVKDTLTQKLFLYDEEYYIDKERYMKSNVTIEFNIYDTYSDNVILNNKKTNSTMLEFPLIDSHHIIQKCILTMKKLEKAIFYIKNNLLFHTFTSSDNPTNKDDRNIYDVIINEEWIKLELYLCNIYGINEKWMGITPNMFENEEKRNTFLKNYSMDNPQNNIITLEDPTNSTKGVTNDKHKEMINKLSDDKNDTLKKNSSEVEKSPSNNNVKNVLNNSQYVSSAALKDEKIVKKDVNIRDDRNVENIKNDRNVENIKNDEMIENNTCNEVADEASQRRRKEIIRKTEEYERRKELEIKSDLLLKKLENEMKYDPNHYMWKDLYPQLSEHHKNKTDKYFENLKKEMSENKYSRGYTDNIKKKQSMKGYDIGEKIEGRTKYYIWYEQMFSFSLYFFLRPYIKKKHILIDIDNHFFSLTINKHNIIKDIFNHPINSSDSVWSLTDNEDHRFTENEVNEMQFPLYDITNIQDEEIQKFIKSKYSLVYNIYKDNNHKYMWGSIFKSS